MGISQSILKMASRIMRTLEHENIGTSFVLKI